MSKGEKWLKQDEELLYKNYNNKSREELLKMFPNRTWKAIRTKANTMNLKLTNNYKTIQRGELYKNINGIKYKKCKSCRVYYPLELKYFPKDVNCNDGYRGICKKCKGENFAISTYKKWSEEEIKLLKDNYSKYSNSELIELFFIHRNNKQLVNKAQEFNLTKDESTIKRINSCKMTDEVKRNISEIKKKQGIMIGKLNPMYNSKRFGKLNPNWKGGISNERNSIMRSEKYKEWRKEVFKRDNYTCQCCGKQTHNLEAHHLNNFADFKEERFNINNGITLCKKCHNPNQQGSFHNEYGTLHNTKEQFEEWLKKKTLL